MSGLEIILLAVVLWIVLLVILTPQIRKSRHISFYGPAIMVKALKNRGWLDKLAKIFPRELTSRAVVVATMAFLLMGVAFLLFEAYLSLQIKATSAPSVSSFLILPGINPFIPVFYGTFALVFSVVIHEIMHGVIARKNGIRVNSVGALFLVIPIGAFVEPDQEEISKADPVIRRRVFAAGPATNLILAIIFFVLLVGVMMPAASPVHDGVYILSEPPNNYLGSFGIGQGSELISYGNYSGASIDQLGYGPSAPPGTLLKATFATGSVITHVSIPSGIYVYSTYPGFPAEKAGLQPGQIFYSINGTMIERYSQVDQVLNSTAPGTTIPVVMIDFNYSGASPVEVYKYYNVTTVSKYSFYNQYAPAQNSQVFENQSFMGFVPAYIGLTGIGMNELKSTIFGASALTFTTRGVIETVALPFLGLTPVPSSVSSLFTVPAPSIFWIITDMVFWLFWMNFLLGLTNALPIFIFDGGQFTRDTLVIASRRKVFSFLAKEENVNRIMYFLGLFMVFLIIWQIVVPQII